LSLSTNFAHALQRHGVFICCLSRVEIGNWNTFAYKGGNNISIS
jgi:hypothetical protein